MKYPLLFFLLLACPATLLAQGNMLLLKKNGKVMKSYYEGSEILFNQGMGTQRANIELLKDDSLFLIQYDVRTRMTNLGVYILDTVATYRSKISYKDIISLGKMKKGWNWNTAGASLFGGGALLTTAGLITWVVAKPNTRYYARPALVITAAALTVVGYLLMKSSGQHYHIGKKYTLQFISTQ